MTSEIPLVTVWYATGNNVTIRGDIMRRVIPIRLEAKDERPEERSDFKHERLMQWVAENRGNLVADGLTILSAYLKAGKPGRLKPLGSFEDWSDVVRSAINWATGIDPCGTRYEFASTDADTNVRVALIHAWEQEIDPENRGVTAAEALNQLRLSLSPNSIATYPRFHAVVQEISRTDALPNAKSLGRKIGTMKGRIVEGKYFYGWPDHGTMRWQVRQVDIEYPDLAEGSEGG
jgi:putative DNA primase/helicase